LLTLTLILAYKKTTGEGGSGESCSVGNKPLAVSKEVVVKSHLQNQHSSAKRKFMLIQKVESAERETRSWRKIRCTKDYIGEVREWFAFIEGIRFAGKELPISIRKETLEYIEMLLTADLVRLNERSAK
jgi:hypothetical protein